MKLGFLIICIIIAGMVAIEISLFYVSSSSNENKNELIIDSFPIETKKIEPKTDSIFKISVNENEVDIINDKQFFKSAKFELDPDLSDLYNEIGINKSNNAVVVIPTFTAAAYETPGFYSYYKNECDTSCLSVTIKKDSQLLFESSANAVKILTLLGYPTITDIDVEKNPSILSQYEKIIILHNEYVTQKQFDAITAHPKVIYLYPNALYAEINYDSNTNSITLLRGHSYPTSEIKNGFGWEFDNSELEYDTDCYEMGFKKVKNGWQLNCYPEYEIYKNAILLKTIKDL